MGYRDEETSTRLEYVVRVYTIHDVGRTPFVKCLIFKNFVTLYNILARVLVTVVHFEYENYAP